MISRVKLPDLIVRQAGEKRFAQAGDMSREVAAVIPVAAVVIMCQAADIPMAVAEDTVRQESRSLTGFSGLVRG